MPESEGWWRCSLHGRQGLAPANRLQVLTEAPTDRPWPPSLTGLEETLASPTETYQVPTLLRPPPASPVYEHMKSWVEGPSSPKVQVYELPDPPASARIVCETMLSVPKQVSVFPKERHRSSDGSLATPSSTAVHQSKCPTCEPDRRQDGVGLGLAPTSVGIDGLISPAMPLLCRHPHSVPGSVVDIHGDLF